ncbi:MAG: GYD domain-containing protein [Alphaproteobacteria bacterium]
MPVYISLVNYTDQGIRNIKQSPTRLDAVKDVLRKMGGKMRDFFLTMGPFDAVLIAELPDDETAARFALAIASQGNIRTTSLVAFTEERYRAIIGGLG